MGVGPNNRKDWGSSIASISYCLINGSRKPWKWSSLHLRTLRYVELHHSPLNCLRLDKQILHWTLRKAAKEAGMSITLNSRVPDALVASHEVTIMTIIPTCQVQDQEEPNDSTIRLNAHARIRDLLKQPLNSHSEFQAEIPQGSGWPPGSSALNLGQKKWAKRFPDVECPSTKIPTIHKLP